MKNARITIRAAHNRDTRKGEQSVTRELPNGLLLMGLKAMTEELIEKMEGDYFYVTGVDIEMLKASTAGVHIPLPHAAWLKHAPDWDTYGDEDDYDPRG